jgi:hypothetical protein
MQALMGDSTTVQVAAKRFHLDLNLGLAQKALGFANHK